MAHSGSISVRVGSRSGRRRRAWGFEPLEDRVVPSTITVMNTNDSGPGSLRAAIAQADMDTAQDTIDFAPSAAGTITLLSALSDLTGNTILSGPGASALTVARSATPGTPDFRIFTVDAGAQVAISGLTIAGGLTSGRGGGIENAGTLAVTDSTLTRNSAIGGFFGGGLGGGIDNAGTLAVTDSTLSDNSAIGGIGGFGGGIENSGTVTVTDATFSGNGASGGGNGGSFGGGIDNKSGGTVTVTDATFSNNTAAGGTGVGVGGGIDNAGTVTVTDATFKDNMASGFGGGIENSGTVTVTDATLDGNTIGVGFVGGAGGGIDNKSGGMVTVANSTFSGNAAGGGTGGGLFNSGILTVIDATLSGNTASVGGFGIGGDGGGIDNAGTATVTGSTLSDNSAGNFEVNGSIGAGGGIENSGTLTVTNSTFSGNSALSGPPEGAVALQAHGGGIDNSGKLTVTDSTFDQNKAAGEGIASFASGGGIENSGTLAVTGSTFTMNSALGEGLHAGGGSGGGIDNAGTLTITGSTLSGNSSDGGGGGITNLSSGTLTVTGSTLSGNTTARFTDFGPAGGTGGGIDNAGTLTVIDSTLSDNSTTQPGYLGSGHGGGIDNEFGGTLTLTNSTLTGNLASVGGGIDNRSGGTLTLTNSILSGNTASSSGGGIENAGMMTVTNSTLSNNSAFSGGGIFNEPEGAVSLTNSTLSGNSGHFGSGGGIDNTSTGTVATINSIFANSVGGNLVVNPGATFVSLGHNLFSDQPAVALKPTDLINTNPLLAPLGHYGGPTETQPLLPGSPAIDAGVALPSVTTDQRGVSRPQGKAPDIGAFESRGFTLAPVSGGNQSATPGFAFPAPLVVAVASPFGEPVIGGRVTFVAPQFGASALFTGNPATIGPNGQASVFATANTNNAGAFTVTAQANGATSRVAFPLTSTSGTVASVQRLGVHQQPTQLLLFFNGLLDPSQAENLGNYTLTTTGPRPRVLAIDAAVYDPTTRSVTLVPHERLSLTSAYHLTVRGGGPHGTDFTTRIFGGGFPRWVGATGPGLSNSPLGNNGPTASAVDALFARSARISARRHRR
jgi:hypothetical protein